MYVSLELSDDEFAFFNKNAFSATFEVKFERPKRECCQLANAFSVYSEISFW